MNTFSETPCFSRASIAVADVRRSYGWRCVWRRYWVQAEELQALGHNGLVWCQAAYTRGTGWRTQEIPLFLFAADACHVFDLHDAVNDARELFHVGDFEGEGAVDAVAVVLLHFDVEDGDFFVGQYLADITQEVRAVEGFDGNDHGEEAACAGVPVYVEDAFGVGIGKVL